MTPANLPRDITGAPTADGGAHVIVTVESIYQLLLEVRDDVRTSSQTVDSVADSSRDHETRIRSLERKVWIAAGVAAALSQGLDAVVPALGG